MIAPLTAEILAMSTADRARLAAQLIEDGRMPEIALLLLDGIILDVMKLCIQRESTWTEATH